MDDYYVIYAPGIGEITDRKSRFIGQAMPIHSAEEAQALTEQIRKKYWDARHNCYAYVTGEHGELTRCSDDGEPSGTAGKPILDAILQAGLRDVLVVVTRYFGGTLLGTGGLVRAYSGAASAAISAADIRHMSPGAVIDISTDYSSFGGLKSYFEGKDISIRDTSYTDTVSFRVTVAEEAVSQVMSDVTDLTGGRATPAIVEKGFFPL